MIIGLLDSTMETSQKLLSLSQATWKSTVAWALQKLGGNADLQQIYDVVASHAQSKIATNANWQAKIRQTLQQMAVSLDRGVWALKAAA